MLPNCSFQPSRRAIQAHGACSARKIAVKAASTTVATLKVERVLLVMLEENCLTVKKVGVHRNNHSFRGKKIVEYG